MCWHRLPARPAAVDGRVAPDHRRQHPARALQRPRVEVSMNNTNPSTERMNPEFKAKWLEALRSGRYQQATDVLRDESNCFCCLGVLADIIDPTGWSPTVAEIEEAGGKCGYPYMTMMETMLG